MSATKKRGTPWTEGEDRLLIEHPDMADHVAAEKLARTSDGIACRRSLLRKRGLLLDGKARRPVLGDLA